MARKFNARLAIPNFFDTCASINAERVYKRLRSTSRRSRLMAANHIFDLGDYRVLSAATMVAILAVSAMPLYAQQSSAVKADPQNVFKMISRDKLKIQTLCKIVDLGNQLDQADQVHDIKKVEEVSRKLDQWERKLPEYTEMVGGLGDVDPNSEDAQEIGSIILKLNEFCD
jgi:hypothetical protein